MIERRQHHRVASVETAVCVELHCGGAQAPEERRTLFCSVGDFSTHGVRLTTECAIQVDTPVRITVVFRQPRHHFEHVGRIRWVRYVPEEERYQLGVEFTRKGRADMYAWREFLEARFTEQLPNVAGPGV